MSGDLLPILLLIALVLLGLAIIAAIILAYKYLSVKGQITEYARREFEQWRASELDAAKQQISETMKREAQVALEEWKSQVEQSIRQDAIQKSRSVTVGQVTEQFVPYLPDFPYNPKDARFIGTPIDFVVFDGLYDGEMKKVVFVEIKTGASGWSTRERRIRDAVCSGHVEWKEIRRPVFKTSESVEMSGENV